MFKYYLYLNNTVTYNGFYEIHKKSCPIVKQLLQEEDEYLVDLGFFDDCNKAITAAKALLVERGLDPANINGCLACNKQCHQR